MNEVEARQLLAVEATASPADLKSAYRRMLKLWHPDLFASNSASYPEAIRQAQRINAAYRLLGGDVGRQEVQQVLDEAPPLVGWNGRLIRTSFGRFELIMVLVTAVIIGLSSVIHNWVLGY